MLWIVHFYPIFGKPATTPDTFQDPKLRSTGYAEFREKIAAMDPFAFGMLHTVSSTTIEERKCQVLYDNGLILRVLQQVII